MKRMFYLVSVIVATLLVSCATPSTPVAEAPLTVAEVEPAAAEARPLVVTILHVGDTHSKLEPTQVRLTLDIDPTLTGKAVYVELGGFPTLMSAVETLRGRVPNPLFLHSGDMFQGTLYFTQFVGVADTDFWNLMNVEVATLGNHEFDKGPSILQSNLLNLARFTIVSANVDIHAEPELKPVKILPYTIRTLGGQEVGIIGLTTVETPFISSPGKNILFNEGPISVQRAADELSANGIDKIILLSHQGYSEDLALAPLVSGIDVIVGGHSHTLLGDFGAIGLASAGPYPTKAQGKDGAPLLVVHAWEWGKVLGDLEVSFDPQGVVQSWRGSPKAVVGKQWFRVYDVPNMENEPKRVQYALDAAGAVAVTEYDGKKYVPVAAAEQAAAYRGVYDSLLKRLGAEPMVAMVDADPEGAAKLASYAEGVNQLKGQVIAQAGEDLMRKLNSGTGPIIADGMAWKTGAQIAMNNPGGVRININQGPISVATVYELLPFANTLVTLPLKGSDVIKTLEDGVDYQITRYGTDPNNAYVYVSGITFALEVTRPKGERIQDVKVKTPAGVYAPIDQDAIYKVVVNNFMAAGGDRYDTLKEAAGKYDTGFNDAEVFMEYISGKVLVNLPEERIVLKR
jgi:5'-nucleotidase/UDP-sugar diphosphatase